MIQPDGRRVARRMAHIEPFHVMELLARARALEAAGRSIIHMEIGEPDFPTPEPVMAAGRRALEEGHTHYTPSLGLPALREAISRWYWTREGVRVAPERIIVTPGASGALQLALGVLIDPDDQVLMADPGYPCNRHFVRFVEGEPVGVSVTEATAYQLTADLLQAHWTERTAAVLLASPSNPTGTLVEATELECMAELAAARGGALIVDEIYRGLTYGESPPSALSKSEGLFVVNSFSKYFGMTGWRIGWLVAPAEYVRDAEKLAQNLFIAASTPAQHAALAAFEAPSLGILEDRRRQFEARRNFLLPALREIGFDIGIEPQGAFYIYAGCTRFTDDSFALARDLLENAGVAVTPGIDFGANAPERHLRFAYTTSLESLREGVERLRAYLAQRKL
jgi:aspartate/methionine/tyrosine aminotransferase